MENLNLLTQQIIVAEETNESGNIPAKFVVCDFNTNRNNCRLDRDTIEAWDQTLVNKPLVGKIIGNDFDGHRMRISTSKDGDGKVVKEVTFDTDAFGVFTGVSIEKGYLNDPDEEALVASCELWTRYPKAINLIRERAKKGTLATSWEVQILDSYVGEAGEKVVKDGIFEAHALLGSRVVPADESSRLLEVAECDEPDIEFFEALSSDVETQRKENSPMDDFVVTVAEDETALEEPTVSETEEPEAEPVEGQGEENAEEAENGEGAPAGEDETVETSSLTDYDIRKKLCKKFRDLHPEKWYDLTFNFAADFYCLFHSYEDNELDFVAVTYSVSDDDVEIIDEVPVTLVASIRDINSALSEKDNALLKANDRIQELEAESAELRPYKEAMEKAEAERIEAEKEQRVAALKAYALKSTHISEEEVSGDGDIAQMIAANDEAGIKRIIAERFMASLEQTADEQSSVETSEAHEVERTSANLNEDEEPVKVNPISVYLNL